MNFIVLCKFKEKPKKEMAANAHKSMENLSKKGFKFKGTYFTLGRYDLVIIFEAPDEKAAMKMGLMMADSLKTETLVAVPDEEAEKLLG